ncbi:MAG: DUF6569 family protein [Bacteroidia bacterium]
MHPIIMLIASLCLQSPLFGQFTYDHLVVDYESAIQFENLSLIPVRGKPSFFEFANNQGDSISQNWLPLQEAMARNLILIKDRAGVNTLIFDNLSDQPVMLLSGEVIKGGKQDRIIGRDMILPPNSRRNQVPVFCVEEKRWSSPKEWTYYHEGSMHLRRVVDQSQNQRQVWNEVEDELNKDGIPSKTKAYTSHSKNRQYRVREAKYLEALRLDSFPYPENIIGMIGVSGNVVIGCDLFASSELFENEYNGLIFSYIDEAITFGLPVSISPKALYRYSDNLLTNERMQQAFIQQYGKVFTQDGKIIHITTFDEDR